MKEDQDFTDNSLSPVKFYRIDIQTSVLKDEGKVRREKKREGLQFAKNG